MKTSNFILLILLLSSCGGEVVTVESRIQDSLFTYFQENAHDPSTYEFLSFETIDTITVKDNLNSTYFKIAEFANKSMTGFDSREDYESSVLFEIHSERQRQANYKYIEIEQMLLTARDYVDSLRLNVSPDTVCGLSVLARCRLSNSMGALNVYNYRVCLDNDLKIQSVKDDSDYDDLDLCGDFFMTDYYKEIVLLSAAMALDE